MTFLNSIGVKDTNRKLVTFLRWGAAQRPKTGREEIQTAATARKSFCPLVWDLRIISETNAVDAPPAGSADGRASSDDFYATMARFARKS
jgi:hypothetical protein